MNVVPKAAFLIARWIPYVPRAVIALCLIVPLIALHSYDAFEIWGVAGELFRISYGAALFVAGAIQRANWRQIVAMSVIGCGIAVLTQVFSLVPLFNTPILYVLGPLILFVSLGTMEWFFVRRGSRNCLLWIMLACLFAATVDVIVQHIVDAIGWQVSFRSKWGEVSTNVICFSFWPTRALLAWTAIPLAQWIAKQPGRIVKSLFSMATAAVVLAYTVFYSWGVYVLAERSLAGCGPFSRPVGASTLALRGRESDYELLWECFLNGKEVEDCESPDRGWRRTCFSLILQHEPVWLADRLASRLIEAPSGFLASRAAPILAKHQCYQCAPVLMRYAFFGDVVCIDALDQMGVPQVAMALVEQAEMEWYSEQVGKAGLMHIPIGVRPKDLTISPEIRRRLVGILGKDAGNRLDAWIKLYGERVSDLPSPLTESLRNEADAVVDCFAKWREAVGREGESRQMAQYEWARQQMLKDGHAAELESIETHFSRRGDDNRIRNPNEGDAAYPAFCLMKEYFRQAEQHVAVLPANWDVPTTKALVTEIDDYVHRVDAALAKRGVQESE